LSTAKKREFVTIIKRIMRKISDDVIKQNQMPILDLPKIGYDNTVWSDEKRMLTTGEKKN
jgi:DNA topoisomerase-6 subunit A